MVTLRDTGWVQVSDDPLAERWERTIVCAKGHATLFQAPHGDIPDAAMPPCERCWQNANRDVFLGVHLQFPRQWLFWDAVGSAVALAFLDWPDDDATVNDAIATLRDRAMA